MKMEGSVRASNCNNIASASALALAQSLLLWAIKSCSKRLQQAAAATEKRTKQKEYNMREKREVVIIDWNELGRAAVAAAAVTAELKL